MAKGQQRSGREAKKPKQKKEKTRGMSAYQQAKSGGAPAWPTVPGQKPPGSKQPG